jgi:hypothetical protein
MTTIKVPDIKGPLKHLCWQQAPTMVRCDRQEGHEGPHSWESRERPAHSYAPRERDGG